MSIGSRIKELRVKRGITQEELARKIGVTKGAIANYENEVSSPKIELMYKLFDALDCDANYLHQDDMRKSAYKDTATPEEFEKLIKPYRELDDYGKDMVDTVLDKESERIKKYGKLDEQQIISLIEIDSRREPTVTLLYWEYGVSAGNGIYQLNDTLSETMHLWATELTKQADFIIKVHGSSMEPDYHDGDRVLVDRKVNVNIGEVGIFIKNGETYIKELGTNELISRNPECENIFVKDFDNVVCMGKVIGIVTESMIVKEY